jgi:hypothetical protein
LAATGFAAMSDCRILRRRNVRLKDTSTSGLGDSTFEQCVSKMRFSVGRVTSGTFHILCAFGSAPECKEVKTPI